MTISVYVKTKAQINCAETAQLISTFVFATPIVHFLFFLNPKFPASSHLLYLYSSVVLDLFGDQFVGFLMRRLICLSLYPPQNEVLGGYTVFSLSVIPSFRHSVNILTSLLNNLSSFCSMLFKFSTHLHH